MAAVEGRRREAGRPNTAEDHYVKAKFAFEAGEYDSCKRHAIAHIASNPSDVKGHNLLGDLFEKEKHFDKAVESLRRSWELKSNQKAVILKLANIFLGMPDRHSLAEVWVDRAVKLAPNDAAVKRLQEQLLTVRASKADLEQLVGLLNRQLSENPLDMSLHIRYVEVLAKIGRLSDAFRYCVELDTKKLFYNEVLWLSCYADTTQKYLDAHELAASLRPQNNAHSIQRGRTTQLLLLPVLSRIQQCMVATSSCEEAQKSLLRLDSSLARAWESSPPSQTSLGKKSLWTLGLNEIRAQLYFHVGVLLLKTASGKDSSLMWETATNLACVAFCASLAQPLFPKESAEQPSLSSQLHLLSCRRVSEAGHILDNFFERFGVEWMQQAIDQHCTLQGQGKLVEAVFGRLVDTSQMFLYNDSQFVEVKMELPGDEMEACDSEVVIGSGGDLTAILWLMRCQPIPSENFTGRVHRWVKSLLPTNFYMETSDIHSSSPDTLCAADVEAFLVCLHQWSQCNEEETDGDSGSFQPDLLPMALSPNKITEQQLAWWCDVLDFSRTRTGDRRRAIRSGLQELRASSAVLDPDLLLALAFYFASQIEESPNPDLLQPWQTRCLRYIDNGLQTVRSLQSGEVSAVGQTGLFPLSTVWSDTRCRRSVHQFVGVRRSMLNEGDSSFTASSLDSSFASANGVDEADSASGRTSAAGTSAGGDSAPAKLNTSMLSRPDEGPNSETTVIQLKEGVLSLVRLELAQLSSQLTDFHDQMQKQQETFMDRMSKSVEDSISASIQRIEQQSEASTEKLGSMVEARMSTATERLEKQQQSNLETLGKKLIDQTCSTLQQTLSKQQDAFTDQMQQQLEQFVQQAGYYADQGEGYSESSYYGNYADSGTDHQTTTPNQNFQVQSQTSDYQRHLESVTPPSVSAMARITTPSSKASGTVATPNSNVAAVVAAASTAAANTAAAAASAAGATVSSPFQGVTAQTASPIKPLAGFSASLQKFQSSAATLPFSSTSSSLQQQQHPSAEPAAPLGSSSAFAGLGSLTTKSDSAKSTAYASPPKTAMQGSASQFKAPSISVTSDDDGVVASVVDNKSTAGRGDDGDGDDANLQFEPVIPLPDLVTVTSGEEDEEFDFCERTKLFRFIGNEWKERGIGDIKILRHKTSGIRRIVMRREQVLKICANHRITADMELKPMKGSDRAWIWQTLADISDDGPRAESFVAKFKTSEIAASFKSIFEQCVADAAGKGGKSSASSTSSSDSSQVASKVTSAKSSSTSSTVVSSTAAGSSKSISASAPKPMTVAAALASKGSEVPKSTPQFSFGGGSSIASSLGLDSGFKLGSGTTALSSTSTTTSLGGFKLGSGTTAVSSTSTTTSLSGFKLSSGTTALSSTSTTTSLGGFKLGSGTTVLSSTSTTTSLGGFKLGSGTTAVSSTSTTTSLSGFKLSSGTTALSSTSTTTSLGGFKLGSGTTALPSTSTTTSLSGFKLGSGTTAVSSTSTTTSLSGFKLGSGTTALSSTPMTTSSVVTGAMSSSSFSFGMTPSSSGSSGGFPRFGSSSLASSTSATSTTASSSPLPFSFGGSSTAPSSSGSLGGFQTASASPLALSMSTPAVRPSAPQQPFSLSGGIGGSSSSAAASSPAPSASVTAGHGDDGDGDDANLQFEPVIPLPDLVTVTSGEEDEESDFCERTKLFRFIGNEWKERGIGDIKILRHKTSGIRRIVMRREQVLKICANHRITADMELKPMKGSDRAWIWQTLADISDDGPRAESFVAKFKTSEIAASFKSIFEQCVADAAGKGGKSSASSTSSSDSSQVASKVTSAKLSSTSSTVVSSTAAGSSKSISASAPKPMTVAAALASKGSEVPKSIPQFSFGGGSSIASSLGLDSGFKLGSGTTALSSTSTTTSSVATGAMSSSPFSFGMTPSSSGSSGGIPKLGSSSLASATSATSTTASSSPLTFPSGSSSATSISSGSLASKVSEVPKSTPQFPFSAGSSVASSSSSSSPGLASGFKLGSGTTALSSTSTTTSLGGFKLESGTTALSSTSTTTSAAATGVMSSSPFSFGMTPSSAGSSAGIPIFGSSSSASATSATSTTASSSPLPFSFGGSSTAPSSSGSLGGFQTASASPLTLSTSTPAVRPSAPQQPFSLSGGIGGSGFGAGFNLGSGSTAVSSIDPEEDEPSYGLRAEDQEEEDYGVAGTRSRYQYSASTTSASETCGSPDDDGDVELVYEKKPSPEAVAKAKKYMLPESFFLYEDRPPCPGCRGCYDELAGRVRSTSEDQASSCTTPKSTGQTTVAEASHQVRPVSTAAAPSALSQPSALSSFSFGGAASPSQGASFASLASSSAFGGVGISQGSSFSSGLSGFQTRNVGKTFSVTPGQTVSVFGSPCSADADAGEDPDPQFEPVIPLPDLVTVRTGEENEDIVFKERAKLFRYVNSEWKERGLGDVKILRHKETRAHRVLMRRENIHKICANHAIQTGMSIKLKDASDRALVWYTPADLTERPPQAEKFCIRFKTPEIAEDFRTAFEQAL